MLVSSYIMRQRGISLSFINYEDGVKIMKNVKRLKFLLVLLLAVSPVFNSCAMKEGGDGGDEATPSVSGWTKFKSSLGKKPGWAAQFSAKVKGSQQDVAPAAELGTPVVEPDLETTGDTDTPKEEPSDKPEVKDIAGDSNSPDDVDDSDNSDNSDDSDDQKNILRRNPKAVTGVAVSAVAAATITTLCILSAKELKRKNATLKTVLKKLVTPSTFKETLREYPKTSLAVFVSTGLVGGGVVCGGIAGVKRLRK